MAHRHRQLHGAPLAEAARTALAAAGEKWTPMRACVFEALGGFGRPASAYEVAAAVSTHEGRRVPPNSIYRILDLFVAANLAIRVESANAYVANAHPSCRHDCLFLICEACGALTHLDEDSIGRSFRHAAEQAGFAPARSVLEMRGRCAACQNHAEIVDHP